MISIGLVKVVFGEAGFPFWSTIESEIVVERFVFGWDVEFPNKANGFIVD